MSHDSEKVLDGEEGLGGSAATLPTYTTGFVLAVILTVIPFALVGFGMLSKAGSLIAIAVAGVIQVLVHLYFFLHLDVAREHRMNTVTGVFAALILGVLVGGTVWLFYSLGFRTMPIGGMGGMGGS